MVAQNRRKDGRLLPAEVAKVGASAPGEPFDDLWEEITRLRGVIRQVSERAAGVEAVPDLLRVLDGLGLASVRLANLLRAQRALEEEQTAAALSRALDAVIRKREK